MSAGYDGGGEEGGTEEKRRGRRKEFLCRWEEEAKRGMRGWVWKSSGLGVSLLGLNW